LDGETRNLLGILSGKLLVKWLDVDGRVILKWILQDRLQKYEVNKTGTGQNPMAVCDVLGVEPKKESRSWF